MLVISREQGESFTIGNDIKIVVVQIKPGKVRIGIDAPRDVQVVRDNAVETDQITDK